MTPARRGAGTTQEAVRRHNLGTVLAHVHHDGQLSRAELTLRLGLNRSTTGALVGELVTLGAVVETAPSGGRTGAGRPSLDVRANPRSAVVVSVEVAVGRLRAAVVGLGGEVLGRETAAIPASRRPDLVAAAVLRLVRRLAAAVPDGAALLGLGVSVPGVIREPDGVVKLAPNLGWADVPLADMLRARLPEDLPVAVANDADLGALAEHTRGAAVGCDDVVFLAADAGIGGGVIVGGRPLQGVGGYAGELGHLGVNPRGRTCRCGSRGCWETEVAAEAIGAALGCREADAETLAARLAALTAPTPALRSVGRSLGLGLGSVVNVLNPEIVVLGGVLRSLYPLVRADVDAALGATALPAPREQVRVVVAALGADSVLLGAAELAFAPLLTDPALALTTARRDAVGALAPQQRSAAVVPA